VTGDVRLADCWAGDLTLAGGGEPFAEAADPEWELAGCGEPHAYELWLDETVWSERYTILCVGHTAAIRALPHGGIVQITSTSAGAPAPGAGR
jgi:hypothetical protein